MKLAPIDDHATALVRIVELTAQREALIKAAKHAIKLIQNAQFIGAWHHLRDVLAKIENP